MVSGGDALPGEPVLVRGRGEALVERVEGGQQAGADEVVVAERLADPEVGEDRGGDPAVEGFEGGRGGDGDQEVGAVEDLAHVPVHETEVGGRVEFAHQLLEGELLQVRGVFARLGAELEEHLAARVEAGVVDQPPQDVGPFGPGGGHGRLGGEDQAVASGLGGVGGAAEEGQGGLDDRVGAGADALVDAAETLGVVAGVGEDDIGAVAQEEPVGELLVDDADVAGDDHRASLQGQVGQALEDGPDGAADKGEDDHVVPFAARLRVPYGAQELRARHLARGGRGHPGLGELARGGRGPSAQDVTGGFGCRRGDAARGEGAPFPPGVGIGEYGDPYRFSAACWHVEDARRAFRFPAQLDHNKG